MSINSTVATQAQACCWKAESPGGPGRRLDENKKCNCATYNFIIPDLFIIIIGIYIIIYAVINYLIFFVLLAS